MSEDKNEQIDNNNTPAIALFGDTKTGLLLLATHILACITVGIILARFSKRKKFKNSYDTIKNKFERKNNSQSCNSENITFKNLGEVLTTSINNSISTILMIGGFVVIFSVIITLLLPIYSFRELSFYGQKSFINARRTSPVSLNFSSGSSSFFRNSFCSPESGSSSCHG